MKSYKVIHLSNTPLVGAPGKISESLNLYSNLTSKWLIEKDYPNKIKDMFKTYGNIIDKYEELEQDLVQCDIIHIHNFISNKLEDFVLSKVSKKCKFIYHVHSPLREGPIFYEFNLKSKIKFDRLLAVGQYQPRFYQNHLIVPNIIMFEPTLNLIKNKDKINILFSPAHYKVGGRWNDKVSDNLNSYYKELSKDKRVQTHDINGVKPEVLYKLRTTMHITIDEVVTGSFHQVSLEGMAAGNVVINNSDYFSNRALESYSSSNIPFYRCDDFNIKDRINQLINNYDLIRKHQQESFDFFNNHLKPNKLIKIYTNIYEEVMNEN